MTSSGAAIEQGQQIRMLQVRRDLDLAQEPLRAEDGAELRVEHLDRDVAIVFEIAREINGRHAAAAELAIDDVQPGERGVQVISRVHGDGGGMR